ncbi:hypothetical protein GUJ93_ZPchr0005g15809 [Zizania palustris]|uniref:Uncharacterized protein n=1 Tax=Zizania palustris TaxID=103762 RepID=A0A8J5T4S4_ZIZPA|nr:hypothetical protein GUJ93_ZPchr0005g15809 [Zizania palustris]
MKSAPPLSLPVLLAQLFTSRKPSPREAKEKEDKEEQDVRRPLGSKVAAPTIADLHLTRLAAGFTNTHDLTDAMLGETTARPARPDPTNSPRA